MYSFHISAARLLADAKAIHLSPVRRKDIAAEASKDEQKLLRSAAGKMGYLGVSISPLAAFCASYIQQIIPKISIAGVKYMNGICRDVIRRDIKIRYLSPKSTEKDNARICIFSDAGFPRKGIEKRVAQEACVYGISFGVKKGDIFHTIGWLSRKQRRKSDSSGMAEAIAASTSIGCAIHVQTVWQNLTAVKLPITIVIDNLGLHRSLSTQSQPTDMGMAAEVHGLRLDYENGIIDTVSWIEGAQNPANSLTKPLAGETTGFLDSLVGDGKLPVDIDKLRHYGPAKREED